MTLPWDRSFPNPLALPELISRVIGHVEPPASLVNCACVNRAWNVAALRRLYRGSLNDMRYRTPDISSLSSLYVASRERFTQNMQFVRHLTIKPNKFSREVVGRGAFKYVTVEECRILRDRRLAELLLRPMGKGITSLAIPFELEEQDLRPLSDLILQPNLKSLTVDQFYCSKLDPKPLASLKSLSIYRTNRGMNFPALFEWLRRCNLSVFQIDSSLPDEVDKDLMKRLIQCLWRHRNLQALALKASCANSGYICADLETKMETPCWPGLKALYLTGIDLKWLEMLSGFKNLQIFELKHEDGQPPLPLTRDIASGLSLCRNLQVIDVVLPLVDEAEAICDMVDGSRQLRLLSVAVGMDSSNYSSDMKSATFRRLLERLPHVEYLQIDIVFQMTCDSLQHLAELCPRLRLVNLLGTRLDLSVARLRELPPLPTLEDLNLRDVRFTDAEEYMHLSGLKIVAPEWARVFPRIRHPPCYRDREGPEIKFLDGTSRDEPAVSGNEQDLESDHEKDLNNQSREPSSSSTSSDSSSSWLRGSDLEDDSDDASYFSREVDYNSKPVRMRCRLWKYLGYVFADTYLNVSGGVKHLWQTNLEIEAFNWPVIGMQAYLKPASHSSTVFNSRLEPRHYKYLPVDFVRDM